jgi:tetratricopeptide (TPR) repeat protein
MIANAAILRLVLMESVDPKHLGKDAELGAAGHIATLEELGDEVGLAKAWRLVGDLHWQRSRYAAADVALARAISHARRAGAAREEAECLGNYVGSGIYGPAHVREVERRCQELLASEEGVAGREAPALRALASVRAMEGRFEEARDLAGRARAILEEFGFRMRASWVWETSGEIEMLAGDSAAAEDALRKGLDSAVAMGEQGFQSTVAAMLGHALVEQGRLEEADELTRASEATAADDDMASQVLWRSARARVAAESDAPSDGEVLAREAIALVEQTDDVNMHGNTLVDLALVLVAAGRFEEAVWRLDEAIALFTGKGNIVAAETARRRVETIRRSLG